jgi:hypothetical protein
MFRAIMKYVGASTSEGVAHTKQPSLFSLNKKAHVFERRWIAVIRGENVPFLREICPWKKCTPKIGANIGAITGILLNRNDVNREETVVIDDEVDVVDVAFAFFVCK